MEVTDFLSDRITYDPLGQYLFAVKGDGHHQMIAELRGFGMIQNIEPEDPEAFQDRVGQFIADAINEKIEREKKKPSGMIAMIGSGMNEPMRDFIMNRTPPGQGPLVFEGSPKAKELFEAAVKKEFEKEDPLTAMIKEYRLIKNKQSKLTKSKRDAIVQKVDKMVRKREIRDPMLECPTEGYLMPPAIEPEGDDEPCEYATERDPDLENEECE